MTEYTCRKCGSVRNVIKNGGSPNLQDQPGAWYLCWCKGDSTPTRMTSVDDQREVPALNFLPSNKKQGKKLKTIMTKEIENDV